MPAAHLETEQQIATLVELRIPNAETYRIQNYCPGEYFFCGQPYTFCDFEGSALASRQIELSNTSVNVTLGNRSARVDSLRPIRESLRRNSGWRRAPITLIQVWPDFPNAPPVIERLEILSSAIEGGRTDLVLKSPAEAINAIIPSTYLTQQTAPELPRTRSGAF